MSEGAASQPGVSSLSDETRASLYLDLWKKSVDVQQHFNDIAFRIRGLALTVATFALGAGAVAAANQAAVGPVSVGAVVIGLGWLLWQAFYFLDRYWHLPLLKGAVDQGTEFETEMRLYLPKARLTAAITKASAVEVTRFFRLFAPRAPKGGDRALHSEAKIVVFYRLGGAVLLLAMLALEAGTLLAPEAPVEPEVFIGLLGAF